MPSESPRPPQSDAGPSVELDPGLVRQRPESATRDAHQPRPSVDDQDDPVTQWNDKEHLAEPILLQAQRLLESAGSRERAVAAIERAAERRQP